MNETENSNVDDPIGYNTLILDYQKEIESKSGSEKDFLLLSYFVTYRDYFETKRKKELLENENRELFTIIKNKKYDFIFYSTIAVLSGILGYIISVILSRMFDKIGTFPMFVYFIIGTIIAIGILFLYFWLNKYKLFKRRGNNANK